MFILDASGSMLKRLPDGQRRIAVAHSALSDLVENTLPPGTPFAFRAFGLEEDACRSELLLPLGPLDPAAAAAAIRDVPAINLARTAIARSLALAAADLAGQEPPLVIVLVTDGEETCDGDIDAEIARIKEQGIDLRLTIVGFAIDDADVMVRPGSFSSMSLVTGQRSRRQRRQDAGEDRGGVDHDPLGGAGMDRDAGDGDAGEVGRSHPDGRPSALHGHRVGAQHELHRSRLVRVVR